MDDHYDIFISYTQEDGEIAASLASRFDDSGLRCFLADKGVLASTEWDAVLRDRLRNADHVLVLLTPRSRDSLWVAVEIGAAWVLEKPLIPALMFVEPKDLIEPVRKYKARRIETAPQQDALVQDIRATYEARSHRRATRGVTYSANTAGENFSSLASWDRLIKIGPWIRDANDGAISGGGMYRYLLSHRTYEPPFSIDCRLIFLRTWCESAVDAVNAGIVLGWSTPEVSRQYFNLTFSGKQLFFERIGFRGRDEYLDFEHLSEGVPFPLEADRPYDLSVRVQPDRISVSCDGRRIFDVETSSHSIIGRVGLRPWRSNLRCEQFLVTAR